MNWTVREIAALLGVTSENSEVVEAVSTDTRQVCGRCLFVAIKGANFDGHDFAGQALEAGAAAVVVHRDVDLPPSRVIRVDDTRAALLRIAHGWREKFQIPVVGLTGSVGKTTTKEMVARVLSVQYRTLKTTGNFNNEIGLPKMLFQLDDSYGAAVLEMGMSAFGEIEALSRCCAPTVGIITNIGVSHIENLGSQENICKAKMEIVKGMAKDAPLILNFDDPFLKEAASRAENPVIGYGLRDSGARFTAQEIRTVGETTRFTAVAGGESRQVTLPTVGIHNVYNALAAMAAGSLFGITLAQAAKALADYEPSGMRQKIVRRDGYTVVEDCYNASPDAVKASLAAFSLIEGKRKIAVLGDMLELGSYSRDAHYACGQEAAKTHADILFTYGEQAKEYARGAKELGMERVSSFTDKDQLAAEILETARPGDAILFKASRGMKLEDVISKVYEGWKQE